MKLGQQSLTGLEYECSLLVLENACEVCPLENAGMFLADERVVPNGQDFTDWDHCSGSSSSSSSSYYGGGDGGGGEGGGGSGSSSSSQQQTANPPCKPSIEIVALEDGSIAVMVDCEPEPSSSSSSSSSAGQGQSCQIGMPPETQIELCPDGSLNYTTYFLPDFAGCSWIPYVQMGSECQTSSSSCESARRYCLYDNAQANALSLVFSQEDKPPPCEYRNYCLPEGCTYECENPSLGTPVAYCLDNCCTPGVCVKGCEYETYANCIVCAVAGGVWFPGGVGWEAWYESSCPCRGPCSEENPCDPGCYCCGGQCQESPCPLGCCYIFDGTETQTVPNVPQDACLQHAVGNCYGYCTYTWAQGECEPSNYICDTTLGCIPNPYGQTGMRKSECESTCLPRFYCDTLAGCSPAGYGTSGYTDCSRCIATYSYCDFYEGCKYVYSDAEPGTQPADCPEGCQRYWFCYPGGCLQNIYYTTWGYTQPQCDSLCLQTFYCDNAGGCQSQWSDYIRHPYPDFETCDPLCIPRVECNYLNGCQSIGKGTSGYENCTYLYESGTCKHRYYCDQNNGCSDLGWGVLQPGQTEQCSAETCIPYYICIEGLGCVKKYYEAGDTMPIGGFPDRPSCNSECYASGCTNPHSPNYNQYATCDDGSCITCCNQGACKLDDPDCKGSFCNYIGQSQNENGYTGGCCDSGCLPCLQNGFLTGNDCSPTFNNTFVATPCNTSSGSSMIYYSCQECPEMGACCSAGSCSIVYEQQCTAAGGTWKGAGTICDQSPCPPGESRGANCECEPTCPQITLEDLLHGSLPYSWPNIKTPGNQDPVYGTVGSPPAPLEGGGYWELRPACLRWVLRCVDGLGQELCSQEFGGPTVNGVDISSLVTATMGPEPSAGCYIYVIEFFGWHWRPSTPGQSGWVGRDDVYSITRLGV